MEGSFSIWWPSFNTISSSSFLFAVQWEDYFLPRIRRQHRVFLDYLLIHRFERWVFFDFYASYVPRSSAHARLDPLLWLSQASDVLSRIEMEDLLQIPPETKSYIDCEEKGELSTRETHEKRRLLVRDKWHERHRFSQHARVEQRGLGGRAKYVAPSRAWFQYDRKAAPICVICIHAFYEHVGSACRKWTCERGPCTLENSCG